MVKLSPIDRIVSFISPISGLKRIQAKYAMGTLQSTGYITSGSPKRSMRGWFTSPQTADEDTLPVLENARADSRDLYMSSPIATAAIRRVTTNVAGSGLIFQSRIDQEILKLSDEETRKYERQIEREFNLYAKSKHCDITATQNFIV